MVNSQGDILLEFAQFRVVDIGIFLPSLLEKNFKIIEANEPGRWLEMSIDSDLNFLTATFVEFIEITFEFIMKL